MALRSLLEARQPHGMTASLSRSVSSVRGVSAASGTPHSQRDFKDDHGT